MRVIFRLPSSGSGLLPLIVSDFMKWSTWIWAGSCFFLEKTFSNKISDFIFHPFSFKAGLNRSANGTFTLCLFAFHQRTTYTRLQREQKLWERLLGAWQTNAPVNFIPGNEKMDESEDEFCPHLFSWIVVFKSCQVHLLSLRLPLVLSLCDFSSTLPVSLPVSLSPQPSLSLLLVFITPPSHLPTPSL